MKVCIATPDMLGPIRNGGVGTAFMGLLEALKAAQHQVAVLFTSNHYDVGSPAHWKEEFRRRHAVEFIPLSELPEANVRFTALGGAEDYLYRSYRVYKYLLTRADFDIIHFPDYLGIGYFTVMAKSVGLAFSETPIIVTTHGPVAWSRPTGFATPKDLKPMLSGILEKFAVENCDMVISPSRFLIEWLKSNDWNLPRDTHHAFNNLPMARGAAAASGPATDDGRSVSELVFFGRIEQRKGIYLFIDAINELLDSDPELLASMKITFLGKFNETSIARSTFGLRLKGWPMPWQVIESFDADQALEYLSGPGRLAVMPSLMDNSPCTVVECLERGIDFVATAVGGIPELIVETHLLPAPQSRAVAKAIRERLTAGDAAPGRLTSALDKTATMRRLVELHERLADATPARVILQRPKISVCLLHRDRAELLAKSIEGFRRQTYDDFEVIVVDNGSRDPAAIDYLNSLEKGSDAFAVRVLRQGYNSFPGPARNCAARLASGDVLKFHDDDNISKPDELAIFATAIARGFDLVTCGLDFFLREPEAATDNRSPLMFVGAAGGITAIYNMVGDTNLAIRKAAFEAIGGFSDCGFLYHAEDWLLLAKAQAAGLRIGTIPEPIVWYRDEADRYSSNWRKQDVEGARVRVAHALSEALPFHAAQIVGAFAGIYHERSRARQANGAAETAKAAAGPRLSRNPGDDKALHRMAELLDRQWIAAQIPAIAWLRARGLRSFLERRRAPLSMPWNDLAALARKVRLEIPATFDEQAYLKGNPDVAEAVRNGVLENGYSHYVRHGRIEGRARPQKLH